TTTTTYTLHEYFSTIFRAFISRFCAPAAFVVRKVISLETLVVPLNAVFSSCIITPILGFIFHILRRYHHLLFARLTTEIPAYWWNLVDRYTVTFEDVTRTERNRAILILEGKPKQRNAKTEHACSRPDPKGETCTVGWN
ncbi:unnamed protein product, partial [Ectocarpus sp. 8 AP-2014]